MGRGSSGAGGSLPNSSSGVNSANIKNSRDLVSMRERKQEEVDAVLESARTLAEDYGVQVGQFEIADIGGKDSGVLAYSDGENIGFNSGYFDGAKMDGAYDESVKQGYHPSRGSKSAIEAVGYHEGGHVITQRVADRLGYSGSGSMDKAAKKIVQGAMKRTGDKSSMKFATKISGYSKTSYAECVAEAIADVACNGKKASPESRAIDAEIKSILKR